MSKTKWEKKAMEHFYGKMLNLEKLQAYNESYALSGDSWEWRAIIP